ncbi:MAG: GNAT family N-acetyltransferase [Oscillospiraceae bacterium]|jgi:ribosomal protein S18 acetylase RimI-like enzyme|nr:GNAT family N-acetyltransferase [Oscillospiraceae bacterium]
MTVRSVADPDEKTAVTLAVTHALPAWFSPPEEIDRKARLHRDLPFFAADREGEPVGFLALRPHNGYTAEILNLGVLEPLHGQGVGSRLLAAAEAECVRRGLVYLTVKTLDSSVDYEPYERTRRFYSKAGFLPLEVFPTYWNPQNPCLFLVKRLPAQPNHTDNDHTEEELS